MTFNEDKELEYYLNLQNAIIRQAVMDAVRKSTSKEDRKTAIDFLKRLDLLWLVDEYKKLKGESKNGN